MQQGASLNSWLQCVYWCLVPFSLQARLQHVYWRHVFFSLQTRPFIQFAYHSYQPHVEVKIHGGHVTWEASRARES